MNSGEFSTSRWRKFTKETTFHGFRELTNKTSSMLSKFTWALIITTCTGALIWQTYEICDAYLSERTVTIITTLSKKYPPPKIMIALPTNILLRTERQIKSNLPELDPEAYFYARSIVEKVVYIPNVANFSEERAKRKFDDYLIENNLTWPEALEPYILDVGHWLVDWPEFGGRFFNISKRLIWYPYTYYVLEPRKPNNNSADFEWPRKLKDKLYAVHLNWSESPLGDDVDHINLVSYDLAHDNFNLKKGDKHKITFDITGNKYLNLRRRPCKPPILNDFVYRHYHPAACEETCLLESILKRYPSHCLGIPDVRFSILEFYPRSRPCLKMDNMYVLMESGEKIMRQESHIPDPFMLLNNESEAIQQDMDICKELRCYNSCNQLTIKYQLTEGKLAPDQDPDEASVVVEMPAFDGVMVFEETPMLTIEALVAQWGGLAGLWLGASLMSFFEIIYFWCWCQSDVKRKAKVGQSKQQNL